MRKKIREHRWILLQHKNSEQHIGVIKEKTPYSITIISEQDNIKTFKISNISIVEYKENIYILQLSEIIKKHPYVDAYVTIIVESLKKDNTYITLLTNNNKFEKKKNKIIKRKTKKTTLWKTTYIWLNNTNQIKKFTPIVFFKSNELEFLVILNSYGNIHFIDKNFNNISNLKNKNLNILLKKSKKELVQKGSKLQQLAEQLL